jgi:ABC-type sugar transport system ATPase subunit
MTASFRDARSKRISRFPRAGIFAVRDTEPEEGSGAGRPVHCQARVRTPSRKQDIINLSGGNQQKVILGRWLSEQGVKVLVIDEPTRGIDVGAKSEIYEILYELAAAEAWRS